MSTFEASTTGGMYSLLGGSRNEIGVCVCVCVKWVCVSCVSCVKCVFSVCPFSRSGYFKMDVTLFMSME